MPDFAAPPALPPPALRGHPEDHVSRLATPTHHAHAPPRAAGPRPPFIDLEGHDTWDQVPSQPSPEGAGRGLDDPRHAPDAPAWRHLAFLRVEDAPTSPFPAVAAPAAPPINEPPPGWAALDELPLLRGSPTPGDCSGGPASPVAVAVAVAPAQPAATPAQPKAKPKAKPKAEPKPEPKVAPQTPQPPNDPPAAIRTFVRRHGQSAGEAELRDDLAHAWRVHLAMVAAAAAAAEPGVAKHPPRSAKGRRKGRRSKASAQQPQQLPQQIRADGLMLRALTRDLHDWAAVEAATGVRQKLCKSRFLTLAHRPMAAARATAGEQQQQQREYSRAEETVILVLGRHVGRKWTVLSRMLKLQYGMRVEPKRVQQKFESLSGDPAYVAELAPPLPPSPEAAAAEDARKRRSREREVRALKRSRRSRGAP